MTNLERFFERYQEGANTFDPDLVAGQFAAFFQAAGPSGMILRNNDNAFRDAIPERGLFFRDLGFQSARILAVDVTPLDDHFTMAKVFWHMIFERDGQKHDFRVDFTYVLHDDGEEPRIVFYICHSDQEKLLREAGLLDADVPAAAL